MPFTMPLIFSTLINNMAWAIGLEITLAILGLVNLNIPTLGTMLNWALFYQSILLGRWWWILTPVVLSLFLFIALYWLSVSISEYLDPRTRITTGRARSEAWIEIRDLSCEQRSLKAFYVLDMHGAQKVVKAVNEVNLNIKENEIYGIAGESGCGKSTLLKTLFNAIDPPLRLISGKIYYRIELG